MVPAASIAACEECREGKRVSRPRCLTYDSVAAINDAVLDGDGTINYSIGGSPESSVLGAMATAFHAGDACLAAWYW